MNPTNFGICWGIWSLTPWYPMFLGSWVLILMHQPLVAGLLLQAMTYVMNLFTKHVPIEDPYQPRETPCQVQPERIGKNHPPCQVQPWWGKQVTLRSVVRIFEDMAWNHRNAQRTCVFSWRWYFERSRTLALFRKCYVEHRTGPRNTSFLCSWTEHWETNSWHKPLTSITNPS